MAGGFRPQQMKTCYGLRFIFCGEQDWKGDFPLAPIKQDGGSQAGCLIKWGSLTLNGNRWKCRCVAADRSVYLDVDTSQGCVHSRVCKAVGGLHCYSSLTGRPDRRWRTLTDWLPSGIRTRRPGLAGRGRRGASWPTCHPGAVLCGDMRWGGLEWKSAVWVSYH